MSSTRGIESGLRPGRLKEVDRLEGGYMSIHRSLAAHILCHGGIVSFSKENGNCHAQGWFRRVMLLALAMAVVLTPNECLAAIWYLNATGPGVPYQIWAFNDDGLPKTLAPTIPLPTGVSFLAWPSAI